ncbi:hypothetical protein G647_02289 [Cladophialophora carrionii CBS 160.54]|uniref:Uncharacterized protein n=1 Tax=Cladophialophora carrionii CBS 160.54 TaxID=1279043 RepID=V9DFT3_9EURO|nr:uncharacterized protein G647_02289 [Cladophialophora carrionii CBS 160.54]ETI25516.1 hypothetical protein G647_02289 [Cladophialophora carrionii CBS 160.54]
MMVLPPLTWAGLSTTTLRPNPQAGSFTYLHTNDLSPDSATFTAMFAWKINMYWLVSYVWFTVSVVIAQLRAADSPRRRRQYQIEPASPTEFVPFHYRRAPSPETPCRRRPASPPPPISSPRLVFCAGTKRTPLPTRSVLLPARLSRPGGLTCRDIRRFPPISFSPPAIKTTQLEPRPVAKRSPLSTASSVLPPKRVKYTGALSVQDVLRLPPVLLSPDQICNRPKLPPFPGAPSDQQKKLPPRLPAVPPSPSVHGVRRVRVTKGSRFQHSTGSRASSSSDKFPSASSALSSGSSPGDTVSRCWCSPSQQSSVDTRDTPSTPREATAPHPLAQQILAILQGSANLSPPPPSLSPASLSPASARADLPWFCNVSGCLAHPAARQPPSSGDLTIDSPRVRQVHTGKEDDDDNASHTGSFESSFPQALFQQFLGAIKASGARKPPSVSPSDRESPPGDFVTDSPSRWSLSGDDNTPAEFDPDTGFVEDSFDSVYTPGDLSESPVPDSPTGSVICFRTEPTLRHYTALEPASSSGFFARCGQILDTAVTKVASWVRSWF